MPMLSLTAYGTAEPLSAALRIRQHTQRQAAQLLPDGIVGFWSSGVNKLIELFFNKL